MSDPAPLPQFSFDFGVKVFEDQIYRLMDFGFERAKAGSADAQARIVGSLEVVIGSLLDLFPERSRHRFREPFRKRGI